MTEDDRVGWRPLLICWAIIAAAFAIRAVLTAGSVPLILDTDDAMRLTIVHDLLAGQGWFDHVQHRLNAPFGAEIHWSRLVDVPEAAVLFVLRPFAAGPLADTILAYLWPLLLLGALLWLTARIAHHLGGRASVGPALLLPAGSLITMAEFAPGRLDHHSVQILLALVLAYSTMLTIERPRAALVAGAVAGIGIAVGIEALPIVAAAIVAMGLLWVSAERHAAAMRDFGLSFALTTALALAIGVAPDRWLEPGADAISATYALAAILCGVALLLLSVLPLRGWPSRLVLGAAAGAAVVVGVVASYPPILSGPYGLLDPWLLANWIDRISEAEPWATSFAGEPVYAVAVAVPVLTAILVVLWNIVRQPTRRTTWLVYLFFLLVALGVMALQIRAARFAVPLATPACAVLVGIAWQRMAGSKGFRPIFVALGTIIVSTGIFVAIAAFLALSAFPDYAAATEDEFRDERNACLEPQAFADLAGLPPERIMTPIDLGSHLLLYTPHSVVAAPYHRNQQGVLDTFHFFNEPLDRARDILRARGIGLVVICPAMHEIRGFIAHAPDSFVSLYAAGQLPRWLHDVTPAGSALRVYSVEP